MYLVRVTPLMNFKFSDDPLYPKKKILGGGHKFSEFACYCINTSGGRTGLMVRASDFGSGDPGSILGRVGVFVSLSKRHLLPQSTGNTQE